MRVFQYFKYKKTYFLYYPFNSVTKSLACVKSSKFFPDFYQPFPILSLCWVAPNREIQICCLVHFLRWYL